MKTQIRSLVMVFAVVAIGSVANAITCTQMDAGADNGYIVQLSNNNRVALVQEETIAGPITKATLACSAPASRPACCDQERIVLECLQPHTADGGYLFQITQGGFTGLTMGSLSLETLAGPHPLATLTCH